MKVAPKDYAVVNIAKDEDKPKLKLILIKSSNNGEVIGIDQKQPHVEREVVQVDLPKVLLNLGQNPYPGSYLGLSTKNLYRRTLESELGPVHILCGIKKSEFELFRESAARFKTWLTKNKLDFILNDELTLEIVSDTGKYAGLYYAKSKKLPIPKIALNYEKLFTDGVNLDYVLAHEYGHHIDYTYINEHDKARSSWVSLFKDSTEAPLVEKKFIAECLEIVVASDVNCLRDVVSELEADNVPLFKHICKWIVKNRKLKLQDIDSLLKDKDYDSVKEIWPKQAIAYSNLKPLVSEYACVSSRELLAESFAFKVEGKKLPERVESLLDKSLSLARRLNK